jgi:hypothetical protein
MRKVILAAALLAAAVPMAGVAAQERDPDIKVANGGRLPAGWSVRLDRANAKIEDLKFVAMGKGYHVTAGPAAIYWNPKNVMRGNYTVRGTFTQTKAPTHPEAYGLFIGGKNLDKPTQNYLYFLVRQDGKYLVNHRGGAEIHKLVDWTDDAAVKKANEAGKATNALEIVVGTDSVRFRANGQQVASLARATIEQTMELNGVAGIRVNHNLDVHVDGFEVTSGARAGNASARPAKGTVGKSAARP